MNCESCAAELSAYLDGELSAGIATEVESHLAGCTACAGELESLTESALLVESHATAVEVSPEIWRNVKARISQLPAPAESWFEMIFGRRWLAAVVTTALVLTMGTWGYIRYQDSERALARYMSEYIRERDQQEQVYRARMERGGQDLFQSAQEHPETADNPFVVVHYSPNENPFRSEGR